MKILSTSFYYILKKKKKYLEKTNLQKFKMQLIKMLDQSVYCYKETKVQVF